MTLWIVVVAVGAFHGLSPGMGWPLALSNGLFQRSERAVLVAMLPLALGHFLAMATVLLPFAILAVYLDWDRTIRIGAGLVVVAFGIWRFVDARHPRVLQRVRPTQLTLWSFLVATAHGAGLMLVPIYVGLCASAPTAAAKTAPGADLGMATAVALIHTLAMLCAGAAVAWVVYRWFGLRAIGASWFNLDRAWAASLVVSGAVGWATAMAW